MIEQSPFAPFLDRMNKDLLGWTNKKKQLKDLLQAYKGTLQLVEHDSASEKVMANLGEGVMSKARRTTQTIVVRLREDLYVEFSQKQALKVLKDLIGLYEEKVRSADKEIIKISVSMREVEELLHQYISLPEGH